MTMIRGHRDETNQVDVWQTNHLTSLNCDAAGAFALVPQKKWGIYIIPMDIFPGMFEITIQCTNHELVRTNFLFDPMSQRKKAIMNLGQITLPPK